jgi:outer membrane receptor protein involved in Fe transport
LLGAAPAMAQTQAAAGAPSDSSQVPMEEIVVTGSHIARTPLEIDVPVISLSGVTLQKTGIANLADALNQFPQFGAPQVSGTNSNFVDDLSGISTVSLRNLGDPRTLVLIDGRRTVSAVPVGKGDPAVDVGSIPAFLIEGVDIVTGGGSASYGSEAVAGVVNIRLRDHFEGLEVNEQYGLSSEYGDNKQEIFDLLAGTSFDDKRGHVVFGLEYQNTGAVYSKDRPFAARDINTGPDGKPVYGPSTYSVNGTFGVGPGEQALAVTLPDGRTVGFNPSLGFNREAIRTIQVPDDRISMYGKTSYDITDGVTFYTDARYAHTTSTTVLEPVAVGNLSTPRGFGGPPLNLPLSNPLIPASLQTFLGGPTDDGSGNFADWRRRLVELGDRGNDLDRTQWAVTTGFKGDLMDRFKWDVYYSYSEMNNYETGVTGNVNKLQQELNAVVLPGGTIGCASSYARAHGCVPADIFGAGGISAAAVNYFRAPTFSNDQNRQTVFNADINGPVYTLPYGDLRLAVGFQYRREDGYSRGDPLSSSGFTLDTAGAPGGGGYDVSEYYIETEVPVLKDLPYAKNLSLEASWRYSDYSNSNVGGKQSYRYGLTYAPVQDVQFRIVNSVAIRAPDLSDLYAGQFTTAVSVNDPCSNIGLKTAKNLAQRERNCASFGVTPGFKETLANQQSELGNVVGNPNLTNERAEVLTYGVTVEPRFLPGNSLKVDFYSYKIANAIQAIDQQTAADQCADTLAPVFCSLVRRNPANAALNPGIIQGVDQSPINVGSIHERGLDVEYDYARSIHEITDFLFGEEMGGDGRIDIDWKYEYLNELNYTALAGATTNQRGLFGAPKNKWYLNLGYSDDMFEVNWRMRYEGSQHFADGGLEGPSFGPMLYNDLRVDYHLNDWITPYVGVNNLFDEAPPIVTQEFQQTGGGISTGTTGTNSVPDVYDVLGRFVYFGVKFKMPFDQAPAEAAAYTPPPVAPVVAAVPHSYLVFFDFNKSDLTPQATQIVDQAAANAETTKVTQLTVTGHTDTVGSDAYNMRLSRRRAESVAAELEKKGIASSEIEIVAKGKRDLLVPTADGVREPQNRRVQIVYSGGPTS